MKKIYLLGSIAILLSTACLILMPQTESTPQENSTAAATQEITTAEKSPVPFPPHQHATATPIPTIEPTPKWIEAAPSAANRAIYQDDLAPEYQDVLEALPYASLYSIEFIIANDLYHVSGHETVTYTNAEDVGLKEVNFRLFPNILNGEMSLKNITVDGKSAKSSYSLNKSLLTIQLQKKLEPQDSIVISMDFKITVARTIGSHYSVQTSYDNVLSLAHAYPMIAVYDDEGWNAEIPAKMGDLTYADMSFYVVTVEAPKEVVLVGSGREISREESGSRQRVIYAAGPARDFYLAASPDYSAVTYIITNTNEENNITLRFYARKSQQEGAAYALETAARAIKIFNSRYALYPYLELDFVTTPTDAGGVEYPGMIAISNQYMAPNSIFLEALIAHETGHQWFYNLVGNDQLDEPWLDESLTQFATLQYFTDVYGNDGNEFFRADLESRWASIDNNKIPVGMPVNSYTDAEYSAIVYGRGALFFEALRNEVGSGTFDIFIQDYTQSSAWEISTGVKLKAKAEESCACNLTSLFQEWIYP